MVEFSFRPEKYADPHAARETLENLHVTMARLRDLEFTDAQLIELVAMFAPTYADPSGDFDKTREFYIGQFAECSEDGDDRADLREDLYDLLAVAYRWGPNGSDGQRAGSKSLRWIGDDVHGS